MILRNATHPDLAAMMAIVRQAQASLKSLGIDQWQNGYPSAEIIRHDIDHGHAYVLAGNDGLHAMLTVVRNVEPTYDRIYDGAWLTTGPFVVVHRMAVASHSLRQGIATRLLADVERMALTDGIHSFKVDTHEGNLPMRRTLERYGFVRCGIIRLADGHLRVAYEKVLAD